MEKREIKLEDNDVLKIRQEESVSQTPTSTVFELKRKIVELLRPGVGGNTNYADLWVSSYSGVACQLLREKGGGWIKGTLRLRLEFIPEKSFNPEPDSPLEDLRSDLNIK
jgi:hypothetical protein